MTVTCASHSAYQLNSDTNYEMWRGGELDLLRHFQTGSVLYFEQMMEQISEKSVVSASPDRFTAFVAFVTIF